MRRIPPYSLWLGHVGEARDLPGLRGAGIAALVDLAINESSAGVTRELIYCRFPLVDGPGNPSWLLRLAIDTVASLLRSGTPTLVYCGAGMSRSPAIAAAAVAVVSGRTPDDCLAHVLATGAGDVSPTLWREIKAITVCQADRSGLLRECAKLDPAEEQQVADEGLAADVKEWPEY